MGRGRGIKVFYKNISWVYKTRSHVTMCLVESLMFMTERNDAEIVFNSNTRKELAKRFGTSSVSISRSLSELIKHGVIARKLGEDGNVEYNHFILNPRMYWFGDVQYRKNAMKKYGHLFGY